MATEPKRRRQEPDAEAAVTSEDVVATTTDDVEVTELEGLVADDAHIRRSTWRWIRAAAIVITVYVAYQLVLVVGGILAIVASVALFGLFGIVVALLAQPAVGWLERTLRVPRGASIPMVLAGGVAVVVLLIYLAAQPLSDEGRQFFNDELPRLVGVINTALNDLQSQISSRGITLNLKGLPSNLGNSVSRDLGSAVVSGIAGTVLAIVDIVIVLVVAYWVLRDGEDLRAGFIALLPGRLRAETDFAFDAFSAVIGGYVRAQLTLAVILGVLAGAGCAVIGVPSPLVVGLAVAVFELVPIVGPFLGGAVALLLAAGVSGWLVVATAVLFIIIHVIEAYVLSPRIQARFVRLHPVVALLSLLAGIEAAGFVGAFLAVPAASLLAVFIRAAVGDWREQRPELFAVAREDLHLQRRRRRLLREFRLFRRG